MQLSERISLALYTVNGEIFALYTFSRFSRFSNIDENIYNLNITYIMPYRVINSKNVNLSPNETANFCKFATVYIRENIFIHIMCKGFSHDLMSMSLTNYQSIMTLSLDHFKNLNFVVAL